MKGLFYTWRGSSWVFLQAQGWMLVDLRSFCTMNGQHTIGNSALHPWKKIFTGEPTYLEMSSLVYIMYKLVWVKLICQVSVNGLYTKEAKTLNQRRIFCVGNGRSFRPVTHAPLRREGMRCLLCDFYFVCEFLLTIKVVKGKSWEALFIVMFFITVTFIPLPGLLTCPFSSH